MPEKMNSGSYSAFSENEFSPNATANAETGVISSDDFEQRERLLVDARFDKIRNLCFKAAGLDIEEGAQRQKEAPKNTQVKCEEGEEGIVLEILPTAPDGHISSLENEGADEYWVSRVVEGQTDTRRNKQTSPDSCEDYERELEFEDAEEYKYPTISVYEKDEFMNKINSFYKEQSSLQRKIFKLESRAITADNEGKISLIVEKIGVQKEICELTVEILSLCVYIEAKGKISRYKRILKSHIDRYNGYCDEYEAVTGRPLERLEYGMIDDTVAGKICRPIPTVYYYGSEEDAIYNPYDEKNDRIRRMEQEEDLIEDEWQRYLDGGTPLSLSESERRALEKRNAEKISAIKRATERDVLLVGLRTQYALDALEAKRDFLVRSYGLDKRKSLKTIREIERKIDKINRSAKRAVSEQREDNSRFYLLKALDPENERLKNGARRERIDALRARLNILLAERESVNERLIALYGGADGNLKGTKIARRAVKVRRKSATEMYKKQRRIAKKIDKYRVPADMKERAYDLLNRKTQAVATADECYYKLKRMKPVGRAKRELVLEIKRSNRAVRQLDREIRYALRRLRRTQDRYEDNKEWASVIAFAVVIFLVGAFVWITFGDGITAYFNKLISQLGGS